MTVNTPKAGFFNEDNMNILLNFIGAMACLIDGMIGVATLGIVQTDLKDRYWQVLFANEAAKAKALRLEPCPVRKRV